MDIIRMGTICNSLQKTGRTVLGGVLLFFTFFLPNISCAEEMTFSFGEFPFEETAVVNEKNGQYIVVCSFKPHGKQPERTKAAFNLQKAKGICIKGIASFRKGQTVSKVSGSVSGMMEFRRHEEKDGKLIYYFQVSSFAESNKLETEK